MADIEHTASTDIELIHAWLDGRPATTRRAYRSELLRLVDSLAGKPLVAASLTDLRNHAATLGDRALRSQALACNAIKSFYMFHCRAEVLSANPAAFLKPPGIPRDLTERILTVEDTQRLIAGAPMVEAVMLKLLYLAGLRASELCGLRWMDLSGAADGGKLTVTGKGSKVRTVLIPVELYGDLLALQPDNAPPTAPIFRAERDPSKHMGPRKLLDVVKDAAAAAGLTDKISSHWLRHCHASHAIDAGAPITLVRDTLGHSNITVTNSYSHARPNDGSARFLRTGG